MSGNALSSIGIGPWAGLARFGSSAALSARRQRRRLVHLAQAAALFPILAVFACLPVDWASALGGWLGRSVATRTGASRRALLNLRRALPDNDAAENMRVIRA